MVSTLRSEVCSEGKYRLRYVHAYTREGICTHRGTHDGKRKESVVPQPGAGTTDSCFSDADYGHTKMQSWGTETPGNLIGFRQTPSSSPVWPSQTWRLFIHKFQHLSRSCKPFNSALTTGNLVASTPGLIQALWASPPPIGLGSGNGCE